MRTRLITGLAGPILSRDEASFLRSARPAGIILFSRNCETSEQIRALVASAREAIGADDTLVLIDQEGGRVQRLRPPLGRALPPGAAYGVMYAADPLAARTAARHAAWLVGRDLLELGIDTNCAPVADVPISGAHDIIGDRAYGRTAEQVADLARAVAEGLLAAGVLPVVKHIPGHGRATKDSHFELPAVNAPRADLSASDFAVFRLLNDLPAAMTAHVVFTSIDSHHPASTSPDVTRLVIRGEIAFDGLLMSDDLSMNALSGSIRSRAEAVLAAGSDLALHCNGILAEMEAAAAGVSPLAGASRERFDAARSAMARCRRPMELAEAETALAAVLALHAGSSRTESV